MIVIESYKMRFRTTPATKGGDNPVWN